MPEFRLAEFEPEPFAYLARVCPMKDVGVTVSETFAALSAAFANAGAAPAGPPLAHFRPVEAPDCVSVDLGFPVRESAMPALAAAGLNLGETLAGQAMRGEHEGSYAALRETYDAILVAIRAAGLKPAADMWERYGGGAEDVRVEVIWPVLS